MGDSSSTTTATAATTGTTAATAITTTATAVTTTATATVHDADEAKKAACVQQMKGLHMGVVPTYDTTINYLLGSCWNVEYRACTMKKNKKLD